MSDFLSYYGRSEIDFTVKPASRVIGGLNFQIIPCFDLEKEDIANSLIIDEIAFSLIEDVFFDGFKYAHWGKIKIEIDKLDSISAKLVIFLNSLENLDYSTCIDVCTKEILSKRDIYHPLISKMIEELMSKLQEYKRGGYKFICIWGI